jgi:hypothetical protein
VISGGFKKKKRKKKEFWNDLNAEIDYCTCMHTKAWQYVDSSQSYSFLQTPLG